MNTTDDRNVGGVLRELREATHVSAIQASLRMGWSRGLVGMYERGERTITVEHFIDLVGSYGADPGLALDLAAIRCGRLDPETAIR